MSDVRNCRKCGKIFTYLGGNPICPACKQLDEEDFKRIKDYLYRNPGAGLNQVSVELDINVEKIKRFLKDGRLEIVAEDGNMFLECESCGKSIKSGRLCGDCERNLAANLKSTASQMKSELDGMNNSARQGAGIRYHTKEDGKKI
ncbi:MAG: MerR family transcriptional regulator [Clostridiales bacterium GWC2_40_7]|nr:MAG: MerR family transcriptional regulator [Clostridiales bacterium GWC2_40_7]